MPTAEISLAKFAIQIVNGGEKALVCCGSEKIVVSKAMVDENWPGVLVCSTGDHRDCMIALSSITAVMPRDRPE